MFIITIKNRFIKLKIKQKVGFGSLISSISLLNQAISNAVFNQQLITENRILSNSPKFRLYSEISQY